MEVRLDPERVGGVALQPLIRKILDDVELFAMASVNDDGSAHANTAFYCVDVDWVMYFVSGPRTRHSENIAKRPSVAVAVYSSTQGWDDWKRGLQLFGTCQVAQGEWDGRARALYAERFPAFGRWLFEERADERRVVFFRFVPESIKVLCEDALGEETFVDVALARD